MLVIRNEKGAFKVRVAGVFQKDGKILLLNEPLVGEYWFLPGGRAEMHESTDQTLVREIEEEMDFTPKSSQLLWVMEDFYTFQNVPRHEIHFYYTVELPECHPLYSQAEYFSERPEDGIVKQFHFRWCSLDEISSMDIRPPHLKERFQKICPSHVTHFVFRQDPE